MDGESPVAGEPKSPRKKRGLVLLRNILLVLFLLSGVMFGLRISGGLNEIFESVSPVLAQAPFVGETLVALMDSVERPLNSQERRSLELEEMETLLLVREESLREEAKKLEAERARLEKLQEELEREQEALRKDLETPRKPEESEALASLVQGFEDMSSRKAAGIMSKLSRERAMEIMRALSQEKMAEILAKMEPATAARMVEALSGEGVTGGPSPN